MTWNNKGIGKKIERTPKVARQEDQRNDRPDPKHVPKFQYHGLSPLANLFSGIEGQSHDFHQFVIKIQ
jgi:hypothetical protein